MIFVFTHICTHFCTIFTLLHNFHNTFPFTHVPTLSPAGLVTAPVLWFCRRKKRKDEKKKPQHFSLFEVMATTQGVSLWYLHVNMY
jgi:hypothetical protein